MRLRGKPQTRGGQRGVGKEHDRIFAKSGAGERQHFRFPTGIADDGDLLEIVTVAKEKLRVVPPSAPFPSSEILEEDKEFDRAHRGKLLDDSGLHGVEFGFFQLAADSKDEKAIVLWFKDGAHGVGD